MAVTAPSKTTKASKVTPPTESIAVPTRPDVVPSETPSAATDEVTPPQVKEKPALTKGEALGLIHRAYLGLNETEATGDRDRAFIEGLGVLLAAAGYSV